MKEVAKGSICVDSAAFGAGSGDGVGAITRAIGSEFCVTSMLEWSEVISDGGIDFDAAGDNGEGPSVGN